MFARFCCSLLTLLLAGCATAPQPAPLHNVPASDAWLQYQSTPSHNAVLDRRNFAAQWSTDTGAKINGGLAIVGDTVFVDTFAGDVLALDVRSGTVRWRSHLDNVVMSTPVVASGLVIVGTGDNGGMAGADSGFVYAPNASSDHDLFWGRDGGDRIVALDAATGTLRWQYKTPGEDMPSPVITGGALVFANGDGNAYGVSLRTGEAIWRTSLHGIATMASATIAGGNAIVSICKNFDNAFATIALDPKTGTERWRSPFGNCDASPAVSGERIFVSSVDSAVTSSGYGGRTVVAALDAKSGRTLWSFRTRSPGLYTSVGSSERAIAGTVVDNTLFQALPTDDAFAAFDISTGRVRWIVRTMAPVKMSAVVARRSVYFGDTAGLLYRLEEQTGRVIATKIFNNAFTTSPPVIVGDTLIVSNGASVVALQRSSMK